jgi:hypothetical protein
MLGTTESERLKVTALNLFHPTASPLFPSEVISYYDTVFPPAGEGRGVGGTWGMRGGKGLRFKAVTDTNH